MEKCDVAIVGAGPYGLSAAAHLVQIKGLDVKLFGEPMSFWERHMPERMLLRSPWDGSHLADPDKRFTLDAYRSLDGNRQLADPVPAKKFIQYGRWFHRQIGLAADPRPVMQVERAPQGYQLILGDGETLSARRVVVAAGIQPFAHFPSVFEGLPASLVTHTSQQRDFGKFGGREVLVIGGGQSALEAAAFLHEAGAHVEVLVRNPAVHWLRRYPWAHSEWINGILYGKGDVGPAGVSHVVQHPGLYRWLPRPIQQQWMVWSLRPAGARWLEPRTRQVPIHTGRYLRQVRVQGERLSVQWNGGGERWVDHVVLGTGYRVNVGLYPFLAPELVSQLEIVAGYPRLDSGFESSLPGLHFLGAPAAWSFGPLMRFVAGTQYTCQTLGRRMLQAQKRECVSVNASVLQMEPLKLEVESQKAE